MFATRSHEIERTGLLLGRPADQLVALPAPTNITSREKQGNSTKSSWRWEKLERRIRYADLSPKQRRILMVRMAAEVGVGCVIALFGHPGIGLISIPLALFIESSLLDRAADQRTQQFEGDYTALLLSLASTVRTGLDPLSALSRSWMLFSPKSVIYRELMRFKEDIERGLPEEQAIRQFADSIAYPDINLFRTAMIISRKQGSALGGTLERLARVTRQRQSFRRKVRTAVALQKISATAIGACAIVIAFIQFGANPEAMQNAIKNPMGFKMLSIGVGLVLAGIVWLRSMAKSRM